MEFESMDITEATILSFLLNHVYIAPPKQILNLFSMCVIKHVDSLLAGHKVQEGHLALLCQHPVESLLAVGQSRIGEPPRLADKVIHIYVGHNSNSSDDDNNNNSNSSDDDNNSTIAMVLPKQ